MNDETKNQDQGATEEPLVEPLTCGICKMSLNGPKNLESHFKGKKHRRNAEKASQSLPRQDTGTQSNARVTINSLSEEPSSQTNKLRNNRKKTNGFSCLVEEPHELKSNPREKKEQPNVDLQSPNVGSLTCFICNKTSTTKHHFTQHLNSKAHTDAKMYASRGAEAIINQLSFHLRSDNMPTFALKRELVGQAMTLEDEVITELKDELDEEQLRNLVDFRTSLNGHIYEREAQTQWDSFLMAIRESSMITNLAPPKPLASTASSEYDQDYDDGATEAYTDFCEYDSY